MSSFNPRKRNTDRLTNTATASSAIRAQGLNEVEEPYPRLASNIPAIIGNQPFVWSIKPMEHDGSNKPLYRKLKPPKLGYHISNLKSSQSISVTNGVTKITHRQDDDNAMMNIKTFLPPAGTPPIIFDSEKITEVNELPPVELSSEYKNIKGSYSKTNLKLNGHLNLSSNSKSRLFVQNKIFQKHPKSSLDPSNLPSNQLLSMKSTNWSKYFKKGSKIREQWEKKLEANRIKDLQGKSKTNGTIPPGQAKQLIDLISNMISIVAHFVFKDLLKLSQFAKKYREETIKFNSSNYRLCFPEISSLISVAQSHFQLTSAPLVVVTSSNGVQHDMLSISNGPQTTNQGFASEEQPEGCLINLAILLASLPNHRDIVEVMILLLWLFAESNKTMCTHIMEASKKNTLQYNYYSKQIAKSLNFVTKYTTDRSASDEVMRKEKIEAEETIKSWYSEHYKIFEKTVPPSSKTDSLDNSMNRSNTQSSAESTPTHKGRRLITAPTISSSRKHEPQPPSGACRPSTSTSRQQQTDAVNQSSNNEIGRGYRSFTSGPVLELDARLEDANKSSIHYPHTSVSPGHIRSMIGGATSGKEPRGGDMRNSVSVIDPFSSSFSFTNSQSPMSRSKEGFESVLVKVLSHHGLDSFLIAMNWIPHTSLHPASHHHSHSQHAAIEEATRGFTHFNDDSLLSCSNRITRCKHTDNTSTTAVIIQDIGKMVNQSLRAFGAGEMIDDILEEPAPPVAVLFSPIASVSREQARQKSGKEAIKINTYTSDPINVVSKSSRNSGDSSKNSSQKNSGKSLNASSVGSVEFNGSDLDILDDLSLNDESAWVAPSNVNSMSISRSINIRPLSQRSASRPSTAGSRPKTADTTTKSAHVPSTNAADINAKGSNNKPRRRSSNRVPKARDSPEILSMSRQIVANSGLNVIEDNMKYLFQHAPKLDTRQFSMMLTSLFSDCARTLIVSLSV